MGVVILQHANLFARLDIKDLRRPIAASGNIFAVVAESDAADDALVGERVDKVDVEDALNLRVEDGIPIAARLLVVRRHRVHLEIAERIAHRRHARATHAGMVRSRMADLGRLGVARIWDRSVDLRGGGTNRVGRPAEASSAGPRGRRARRSLRAYAVGDGTLGIALRVGRLRGIRMRRRDGQPRRALSHLMLRSYLLILRRRMLRWSESGLVASGHYSIEQSIARSNGWRLLRRAGMLRWA